MNNFRRMYLSIKTTAACQKLCNGWCVVKPWMRKHRGEETSLENIKALIRHSLDSGYCYERILFSGGEPFLWSHIGEAARMLKDSGISKEVVTYTNGLEIDTVNALAHLFDTVLVSLYPYNKEQAARLKLLHKNVEIIKRPRFYGIPPGPIGGSLPAKCGCSAYGMFKDHVTLCSAQEFVYPYLGKPTPDNEVVRLGPGYLESLADINPYNRPICQQCFGNAHVVGKTRSYPNPAICEPTKS